MLTLLQNPKKHYILEYFFRIETMYDVFTLWVNINQNDQLYPKKREKIFILPTIDKVASLPAYFDCIGGKY